MNSIEFTKILQHPEAISSQQTKDVKYIVDEFPYFQSARAIYLKGLKNDDSFKYNQELKKVAAYTTDRSILFDFITSEAFVQNEISEQIKHNIALINDIDVEAEIISVNKSLRIDEALKQQIQETSGVLDPALFQPKIPPKKLANFKLDETNKIEEATEATKTQHATASDILNLGKPLEFHKSETHSFNEWLKLTRFTPINRNEDEIIVKDIKEEEPSENPDKTKKEASKERAERFALIEKFITKNPKIDPTKSTTAKHNIAQAQMIQPETLMTETLARIYLEQKNYKKAIQSYNILSLKYPEKSGFFADRIKAIKQLQEQNSKD